MVCVAVVAPLSLDWISDDPTPRIGGASYSARAAVAIGHGARVVGPVGTDEWERVLASETVLGIDLSAAIIGPWPTRRVWIDEADEFVEQRTWVEAEGDPGEYEIDRLRRSLEGVDVVLTYGHAPALARGALASAPEAAVTALDLQDVDDPAIVRELVAIAQWVLVSWPSASALTRAQTTKGVVSGLRQLGARNVVLKLGPGGAYVASGDTEPIRVPAFLGPFRWTVGAGDVFNSVFLSELATGVPPSQAAECGSAAAAFFIGRDEPRFGARYDLDLVRRTRLSAFSAPEARAGVRVLIFGPDRTAAERFYLRRLSQAADTHGFAHQVLGLPGHASDAEMVLKRAGVVVAVLDGEETTCVRWLEMARAQDAPAIVFWSSGAEPPASQSGCDLLVRDERELLIGLYAFAAEGREGLSAIAHIFAEDGIYGRR